MSTLEASESVLAERVISVSSLGELRIIANDVAVVALYFSDHHRAKASRSTQIGPESSHPFIDRVIAELREYAGGDRRSFSFQIAPTGTPFQREVWTALTKIPFGETRSYSEIALAIGRPRAARAVGAANALNPISVVVPCHRVIGRGGDLTGYAGGLDRKQWLLRHEGVLIA